MMNNFNNYEVKQRKARKIAEGIAMVNILLGNALSSMGYKMLDTLCFVITVIVAIGFETAGMYYLSKRNDVSPASKKKMYRNWMLGLTAAITFYTWIEIVVVR